MSLERCTITYQEQPYTRLIGRKLESRAEMYTLAETIRGGNYFYGGVLDTGSLLQPFFGQGPKHEIFDEMVQKIAKSRGQVCSGQVTINTDTKLITGIMFLNDPGEEIHHVNIATTDQEGKKRRLTRILALVRAISPTVCEPKIDIGWLCDKEDHILVGKENHISEYWYLPQNDLLRKTPSLSQVS